MPVAPPQPHSNPVTLKPVTLKTLANHLKLAPSTISVVLNRAEVAKGIPPATQDRIFEAARELGYRPNLLAQSLRNKRSHSVGILVPDFDGSYISRVMGGAEELLLDKGFLSLVGNHRSDPTLSNQVMESLRQRQVEGLVAVAAPLEEAPGLPTVAVGSHRTLPGVTNVNVDHDRAAQLALGHLRDLGHRRVAFFRGDPSNNDAQDRWRSLQSAADALGLAIRPELVVELRESVADGETRIQRGYAAGADACRHLLDSGASFTALFAFNDISAIGALYTLRQAGLWVPEDVSVVGFDDIYDAAYQTPSLTTVRQPVRRMGNLAARLLLDRLAVGPHALSTDIPHTVKVEPEFIVRESTARAAA